MAKITSLFCLLFGCYSASPSASDDDVDNSLFGMSFEELLKVKVVSATRAETNLRESPLPISVITAKEIANSGFDNIPDILARLPEIDVMHIGASQTEVSIRGKNINFNRRLLVLIDGRTEYNDLFGVTLWHAIPIAVDDIERIEVVSGPASALFGANAYSGVINIISKRATGKNESAARIHAGSDGLNYGYISIYQNHPNHHFNLSYSNQNADSIEPEVTFAGFNQFPSTVNFSTDQQSLENMQKLNLKLISSLSPDWALSISGGASDGQLELLFQPGLPREKWMVNNQYLQLGVDRTLSASSQLTLNSYINQFSYETPLLPPTSQISGLAPTHPNAFFPSVDEPQIFSGESQTVDLSLQYVAQSADQKTQWLLGAEYRQIENNRGLVEDSRKHIDSIFGNLNYQFLDEQWLLGLALRADKDSITGTDLAHNTSLQYFVSPQKSWRVSIRRAFRAPSLFELFAQIDSNVPNQNHRVLYRGNPALAVETIDSADISYSRQVNPQLLATAEIFYEKYQHLIGNPDSGLLDDVDFDPLTNLFTTTTSFLNLTNATNQGLQLRLIGIPDETLKYTINYRFAQPQDLNALAGETFFTPKHSLKLGAFWQPSDHWSVDTSWNYSAKTDDDEFSEGDVAPDGFNFTRANQQSWHQMNIALHYRPQNFTEFKFYLVVDNLFDRRRIEYFEFDAVLNGVGEAFGRRVWTGVKWLF